MMLLDRRLADVQAYDLALLFNERFTRVTAVLRVGALGTIWVAMLVGTPDAWPRITAQLVPVSIGLTLASLQTMRSPVEKWEGRGRLLRWLSKHLLSDQGKFKVNVPGLLETVGALPMLTLVLGPGAVHLDGGTAHLANLGAVGFAWLVCANVELDSSFYQPPGPNSSDLTIRRVFRVGFPVLAASVIAGLILFSSSRWSSFGVFVAVGSFALLYALVVAYNAWLGEALDERTSWEKLFRANIAGEVHDKMKTPMSTLIRQLDRDLNAHPNSLLRAQGALLFIERFRVAMATGAPERPGSLRDLLEAMNGSTLADRQVTVNFTATGAADWLEADDMGFAEQVLMGLVANSASAGASVIDVNADAQVLESDKKIIRISITDNGPGLAKSAMPEGNVVSSRSILRLRLRNQGGDLIITAAPNGGTCAIAHWISSSLKGQQR